MELCEWSEPYVDYKIMYPRCRKTLWSRACFRVVLPRTFLGRGRRTSLLHLWFPWFACQFLWWARLPGGSLLQLFLWWSMWRCASGLCWHTSESWTLLTNLRLIHTATMLWSGVTLQTSRAWRRSKPGIFHVSREWVWHHLASFHRFLINLLALWMTVFWPFSCLARWLRWQHCVSRCGDFFDMTNRAFLRILQIDHRGSCVSHKVWCQVRSLWRLW